MFDNLRESANSSSYDEENSNKRAKGRASKSMAASRRAGLRFLGMTAPQRFVVSAMLAFTVCLLGTLAMLILGKMGF